MNQVLFSSKEEAWSTPQDFFDKLDAEFHFTLDPAASEENAKCKKFFTKEQDGLSRSWGGRLYFAIRLTGETKPLHGSKKDLKRVKKRTLLLSC